MYFTYFLQYTQTIEIVTKTTVMAIVLGTTTPTIKRIVDTVPAGVAVVVSGSTDVVVDPFNVVNIG